MSGIQQPVLVIMGVSGSGKSTVAGLLAGRLGWDLEEGDDLHPPANIDKMRAGHPLDDDDRAPWLDTISSWIVEHTLAGVPGIITCSALKRKYRDVLRERNVVFVHLTLPTELILRRLATRQDHYMPTSLLDSQVATLEAPDADEQAITIDAGRAPAVEAAEIIGLLGLTPQPGPGQSRSAARPTEV